MLLTRPTQTGSKGKTKHDMSSVHHSESRIPEFLNSRMHVCEDPLLITYSRTTLLYRHNQRRQRRMEVSVPFEGFLGSAMLQAQPLSL